MAQALYVMWLDATVQKTTSVIEKRRSELASLPGDLLIWSGEAVSSHSATGQPRAYRIPTQDDVIPIKRKFDGEYHHLMQVASIETC